jgi:hypothetical protein
VADQKVAGAIEGSELVLSSVPTHFRTNLVAWAVQRRGAFLHGESEVATACHQPLDVSDTLTPQIYSLREVLLNPLSSGVLLAAARKAPAAAQVSHVRNPFTVESIAFDNASLHSGVPRGIVGSADLGASDFPASHYDWDLLCRGIEANAAVSTATVKGSWNALPLTVVIEYAPIQVGE